MKRTLTALLLITVLVSAARLGDARPERAKSSATSDLTLLSIEELIARFQEEPEARLAEDVSVDIDPFVAAPPQTGYWAHLGGTPHPHASLTMRELIRRGVAAVPALLDHLSDARPTKLALTGNTGKSPDDDSFFANEYDPRPPDADKAPPGLYRVGESDPDHDVEEFKTYRLVVGDLCFAALGQIVNRRLLGWRNGFGILFGFNSPVHTPALAAAARADWAGLTDDGFRDFLIYDVAGANKRKPTFIDYYNLAALERLFFYYPADGVALAVKLLDRPIIDPSAAKACRDRLIDTDDEAEQDRLLSDFQAQHSHDEYEYLAQSLIYKSVLTIDADDDSPSAVRRRRLDKNEARVVNKHLTEAEKNPPFIESLFDCEKRRDVVTMLTPYPSTEIDVAVRRLLKRVLALRIENLLEKERQRGLVLTCAEKLLPPSRYKALERASLSVGRKWDDAQKQKKAVPGYVHACDAFMQKIAADPALHLPPGQP